MLEAEPDNTMVMFGLAKEYEKQGQWNDVIDVLERYLATRVSSSAMRANRR